MCSLRLSWLRMRVTTKLTTIEGGPSSTQDCVHVVGDIAHHRWHYVGIGFHPSTRFGCARAAP